MADEARALQTAQRSVRNPSSGERAWQKTFTKLWLAGVGCWGNKWTSSYGELPIDDDGEFTLTGRMWASTLAGFSERHLLATMQRVAEGGAVWPPSLPEFRRACFDIPPLRSVRLVLSGRAPDAKRTPFILQVWNYVDSFALSRATMQEAERLIADAYELAAEHVLAGGVLPDVAEEAIEHQAPPKSKPASDEFVKQQLDGLAERLHMDPTRNFADADGDAEVEAEQQ